MFIGALLLIALRMPVAVAMLIVGGTGYAAINGVEPLLNTLKSLTFSQFANYTLSVIPLFLLMGNVASGSGLSARLFRGANALLGHHRGGMAMAAVGACAAFGTICGSSLATGSPLCRCIRVWGVDQMRRSRCSRLVPTSTPSFAPSPTATTIISVRRTTS